MWGAALVTVASLFTLVAFHVFAAQSAFTLERLSKERTNEQLRYERLRDQVARAVVGAASVIAAADKLGMVPGPAWSTLSVARSAPPATGAHGRPPVTVRASASRLRPRRSGPSARRRDVTAPPAAGPRPPARGRCAVGRALGRAASACAARC